MALFAGIGGSILTGKMLGWRTICAVENDEYCQKILMQRQNEGTFEPFPIWDDIRTFECTPWIGNVDIITAGFPCQPFSVAGKQQGQSDSRNMWPDTIRIIKEIKPKYVFLENVPGLLSKEYFKEILEGIHEAGYNVTWKCLSAQECGAPFKRERLWMLLWLGNESIKEGHFGKSSQNQSITNIGCNGPQNSHMKKGFSPQLQAVIGGLLNPMWCEWYQGFPIGWTELKDLEMHGFQEWQQGHFLN